jgi:anhydro-N-acetylmuramic acid kinase
MNPWIKKLVKISKKKKRLILGLMSGTSLDGLDMALCEISGSGIKTKVKLVDFLSVPYSEKDKNLLKEFASKEITNLKWISIIHDYLPKIHADMILKFLDGHKLPDVLAYHGQTIFHAPKKFHNEKNFPNASLQISDGDHLAYFTNVITISDFRQKHIAAGGEGAPLAGMGDYLLFSSSQENRILLNLGGIANFSFLPAGGNENKVFSSDTGPANTLLDKVVQKYFKGHHFDLDGKWSLEGQVNEKLLMQFKSFPFFNQKFPKTTGQELFSLEFVEDAIKKAKVSKINPKDLLATLAALTGWSVGTAIKENIDLAEKPVVYVSGGGVHNLAIMRSIQRELPGIIILDFSVLGIPSEAKEAVFFAALANETLVGNSSKRTGTTTIPNVNLGKICFPS